MDRQAIISVPLSKLKAFKDHPFKVRDDAAMQQAVESVREYGVLVPAIARPLEDGTYELISGHRRKHACELAGLDTMPVIIRTIDHDAATIIMVDSNLQRGESKIISSEKFGGDEGQIAQTPRMARLIAEGVLTPDSTQK